MDWVGRKVLVTGGAGFLGSNLCHALAARGARVTALDGFLFGGGANPVNLDGADLALPAIELVRGDIREIDLRPLCEGAVTIFNLAAQTSHMGGQRDPLADIAVNAVAQVRLIQAAREAAPDAVVVHASTRQFYGRPQYLPVDEQHPVAPPDANGVSKFAGEQYWMLEHRVRNRPVVSLRLTNCYGPRLRIRDARQTFLGIWIRCVLESRPFEVWGGAQLRDLTYVDDVTVSGERATKTLLGEIRQIVHRHGLKTKQKKSRTYAATAPKPITGAVVAGDELRLPNERHRKIWIARQDLATAPAAEKAHLQKVLRGRLQEARQIVP